ncbi:Peptidase T [bioreactor metagenome]|uniref:Peptidase T n=1 Tax=bioreactor metagenome TaxID=1076179 RepID=A0A645FH78_9ZZZZ
MEFSGDVESAKMLYIIRNHQDKLFQAQKKQFTEIAAFLNQRYPADTVAVTLKDSYKNMKQVFSDKMYIVELAEKAIAELGMEPKCVAIRGGTDGAELTYKGIPCPNLGTGGQNYHGRYEFCCVEDMQAGVKIVLKIAGLAVDLPC